VTISSTKNRLSGYTLVEIILVLGLGAILAVVSVPAIEGWISESRMTTKAGELIELVQSAKLRADEKAEAQLVVLLGPKDKAPSQSPANVSYLSADDSFKWSITRPGPKGKKVEISEIHIDSHGIVEPVTFRVSSGQKYVEYRFDFLTGHAQELGSSF
jgi:Tfp pilus assembly protein FimT